MPSLPVDTVEPKNPPDSASEANSPTLEIAHGKETAQVRLLARRTFFACRYQVDDGARRRNNLLAAVGWLELSNALDFAANVWNGTPPPPISTVFMALGATGALIILVFAVRDIPRAWRNAKLLRRERQRLLTLPKDIESSGPHGLKDVDCAVQLDINQREMGNEVIDRLLMSLLLGFGGFTVGIGTYMAIGGANQTVYDASNVITGYLGNVPAALYGLVNACWCIYGWRRAGSHLTAANRQLHSQPRDVEIHTQIRVHSRRVKRHALINGVSGILGGAGSLMTASAYLHPIAVWGYVILLPCVASAVVSNLFWRYRVNYDREVTEPSSLEKEDIVDDFRYAIRCKQLLESYRQSLHKSRRQLASCHSGVDKSLLINFLVDYHRATVDRLTNKEMRFAKTKAVQISKEGESDAPLETIHTSPLLEAVRAQRARSTSLLDRLRTLNVSAEKARMPSSDALVAALLPAFVSADLFPRLCKNLANDASTASLLDANSRGHQHIYSDSQRIIEILGTRTDLLDRFLQVSQRTLAIDGRRAARSRIRYLCELAGCYFARLD